MRFHLTESISWPTTRTKSRSLTRKLVNGFDVSLPYTERMVERFMLLPLNLALDNDDIHYVCDGIRDFYTK